MSSSEYVCKQGMSRKEIRQLVEVVRDAVELTEKRYFPVAEFLELVLTTIDENFEYEVKTVEEMGSRYAVTYPEEKRIDIREDVYDRAADGNPRDRFTIAHEIGHYLMHSPSTVSFARDSGQRTPPYLDPEWQANTFAGELLAPPALIKGLSVERVMEECGVSRKVAGIQLNS